MEFGEAGPPGHPVARTVKEPGPGHASVQMEKMNILSPDVMVRVSTLILVLKMNVQVSNYLLLILRYFI